jgi:hypothetical protein
MNHEAQMLTAEGSSLDAARTDSAGSDGGAFALS